MHSKVLVALLCPFFLLSCFLKLSDGEHKCPTKCICSKYLRRITCEHQELYDVPSDIPDVVTQLYLGYNKLTLIKTGSFSTLSNLTQLSLLNNHIVDLQNLSFSGLRNLKYLTLRKNKLKTIARDAFQDLERLQKLFLTDNLLTAVPDLSFLPSLIYLTLDTNNLESANLCNGSGNFSKLSTIILSNNANLTKIGNSDFKCVSRSSVRSVDVSRCSLKEFEDDVFRFPHLQSLKLSYNDIPYDMLKRIFNSTVPSDLTSLDLSGVLQPSDIFPQDLFQSLSHVKLKHLSLSHTTQVGHITEGTFQYLPYLEYLDLSNSEFISVTDKSFSVMHNLTRIALHHNSKLSYVPEFNISSLQRLDLNDNGQIEKLQNYVFSGLNNLLNLSLQGCRIRTIERHAFSGLWRLQKLDLSRNAIGGNSLPTKALAAMQNLVFLDLSSNKFTTIATEHNLFSGLSKLRWLDFSQNDCGNISTRIFQPLVNLQTLNLARNRLGRVIESDVEGQLFLGLNKLRSLLLVDNKMTVLQFRMFGSLTGLQTLNMSSNFLASWEPGMFNASSELDIVDFSANKIAIVTERQLLTVPERARVNLAGNPFACDCDLIWFRRWIQTHNSTGKLVNLRLYTCNSPDRMAKKPLLDFDPDEIEARCRVLPLMWILVGACSGVAAVMLFLGTVMYRYRWQLRLRLYYAQRRFRRRADGYGEIGDGYVYDIYVSYGPSDSDREWVRAELMPRIMRIDVDENADGERLGDDDDNGQRADDGQQMALDGEAGDDDGLAATPGTILGTFRVFIEEENATFGLPEFDTLAESIYKAERIILVISDEYLSDGRRRFEMEWAIKSRYEKDVQFDDTIIVVCMEPDADVKTPPYLHPLIKEKKLEWTKDDPAGQQLFWRQLKDKLNPQPL